MQGQIKRKRLANVYTPGQMLQILKQEPQMVALLQHSAIWMAVEPRTAWVLDMCCTGQLEGGPQTAQEVADTLGLVLPPPSTMTGAPPPPLQPMAVDPPDGPGQPAPVPPSPTEPPSKRPHHSAPADGDATINPGAGQQEAVPPASEQQEAVLLASGQPPFTAHDASHHGPNGMNSSEAAAGQDRVSQGSQNLQPTTGLDQGGTHTLLLAPAQPDQAGHMLHPATNTDQSGQALQPPIQPDQHSHLPPATAGPTTTAAEQAPSPQGQQGVGTGAVAQAPSPQGQQGGRGGRGRGGARRPSTSSTTSAFPWLSQPHRWECVRLTLEECFFLQHVLGCLSVKRCCEEEGQQGLGQQGREGQAAEAGRQQRGSQLQTLTDQELWTACCAIRPSFPVSYVGYHHLKCKGWLPRSGLLYGVDYVAYSLHPMAAHSLFAVLLQPLPHTPGGAAADGAPGLGINGALNGGLNGALHGGLGMEEEGGGDDDDDGGGGGGGLGGAGRGGGGGGGAGEGPLAGAYEMGWHDLQITSRVISTVAKKLLLLYLYQAPTSPGHASPDCIAHYCVEERVVRRWVPDSSRD